MNQVQKAIKNKRLEPNKQLKTYYLISLLAVASILLTCPITNSRAIAACCLGDVLRSAFSDDPDPPFAGPQYITVYNQTDKLLTDMYLEAVNREFQEDPNLNMNIKDTDYDYRYIGELKPGQKKMITFLPQENLVFVYQDFKLVFNNRMIYKKPPLITTKAVSNYCTQQPSKCMITIRQADLGMAATVANRENWALMKYLDHQRSIIENRKKICASFKKAGNIAFYKQFCN